MEDNKNQILFTLLSRVYNMYSLDNKEVKDGLLEAAKILQQEDYILNLLLSFTKTLQS
ncbi:hypothetical protein [Enterococcus faecium]|uniref:hypothetical protein n=1 Tax=Enterococcus faecium TaxID=1352 RepID=UPI001F092FB3|nr:hypothetical protein [Enterococcus faecium]